MQISFVVPAYNEEQLLPKCLASIERELSRTPCDAEVIVVNNASTDRTGDIARAHSWVRVVDEPHKGLVRARQAGYAASAGELIANIDSDTMLPPGWLAKVLAEFAYDENLVALSGPHIYYDLPAFQRAFVKGFYTLGYIATFTSHYLFRTGAMLQGGNFIVRRSALEAIGGFDTSIEFYGEDTDIAKRISQVGRVKWTFDLPIYATGRRLAHEGIVRGGLTYARHHFYTLLHGRPAVAAYTDIREKHD